MWPCFSSVLRPLNTQSHNPILLPPSPGGFSVKYLLIELKVLPAGIEPASRASEARVLSVKLWERVACAKAVSDKRFDYRCFFAKVN